MKEPGQRLYEKGKSLIPGGSQLLSKRPERFAPDLWPPYFEEAEGVTVTTPGGDTYVDTSYMGLGASILGYADPDVDSAVREAVEKGTSTTLNCPEEVELAETLVDLHPWADMVRYARTGGEAMAIAVRIARAYSGEDKVAFCGYHGWHDWYLAANLTRDDALEGHLMAGLQPNGVPRALEGSAFPFAYNDTETFEALLDEHGDEIGAVAMEPIRNFDPDPGFLETVQRRTREEDIPLIVDEISAGFRLTPGGAHLDMPLEPDIATFAKGLGNGYPIAAVVGRDHVMEVASGCFISSTFWTERLGPAAALATIEKHHREDAHEHLLHIGTQVQDGWKAIADDMGLPLEVTGIPPLAHFNIEVDDPAAAHTLFIQHMLKEGFLSVNAFYPSLAHDEDDVDAYLAATERGFRKIAKAADGNIRDELEAGVQETLPPRMA